LAVAVALTLGYLTVARDRALAGSIIQAVAAVITLAGVCGAALWRFTRGRARLVVTDVEDHLGRLAETVARQWESAVMERGLRYPAPIPMRWRWSSRRVSGSVEEAAGLPSVVRMSPLPGTRPVVPADLGGGDVEDLFRVYAGLDSGRILLTGKAGGGKSSAAILVLLRALQHRARQEFVDRARVPVPVMLTFYGWDPRRQDFTSWLIDRLLGDYPMLADAGRTTVETMVRDGRISVFLDGLDEIPEDLRPVAVRALDHQATCRIVLLTRVDEMVRTARDAYLSGAAAVELLPLYAGQAANYLVRVGVSPTRPGCQAVATRLIQDPGGALALAVAQPLMLVLLRDRLAADDDVRELMESDRRGDTEGIEDSLLDLVVPLAYRPATRARPVSPTAARELLGFLAANLTRQGVREFAWWDMPTWLPRGPRVMVTAVLAGVLWDIGNGACVLADRWLLGPDFGTGRDALLAALMNGPSVAMFAGLAVAQPGHGAAARRRAAFSRTVILTGGVCGSISAIAVLAALGPWYGLLDAAGTAVFTLLLAKTPRLRRSGGRLTVAFDDPATLSVPAGTCAVFLSTIIRYLPEGIMPALVGSVVDTLTQGLLLFFLQPPRGLTPVTPARPRQRRFFTPTTRLMGLFAAFAFGLITVLMMVDTHTGNTSSQSLVGVAAGLLFFLVTWPVLGLLVHRDVSDSGALESPLRLMRHELRTRLAAGCALGMAISLPVVPQAMLVTPPASDLFDAKAVNLLFATQTLLLFAALGGPLFAVISSRTWQTMLVGLQLHAAGHGPRQLLRYLDDAHRRGILRALGPVYQFRHARLQDRLSRPGQSPAAPAESSDAASLDSLTSQAVG
jgi:hypothetical protein